jgi:hypothetical protein
MAHQILEDMVYSFKIPMWHNLAKPSEVESSAIEILDRDFHGGFELFLRPVTVTLNDSAVETGDFAVVRGKTNSADSKEIIFGYCTERYKPLQPRDICDVFDLKTGKKVETMAFLSEGKEMFISFKMPSFEVVKDDTLEMFAIIRSGFDTLKGTGLFTSIYRPVCANTLAMSANWADKNTDGNGRGNIWNSKHVNKNLLRDLGYWASFIVEDAERQASLINSFFAKLVQTPVKNDDEVKEILTEAFPSPEPLSEFYPKELKAEKLEKIEDENSRLSDIRDGIFGLFSGGGISITPDYYGIMNSTTEYFCHKMPSKKPIAASVMWGNRQKMTMQVVDVLKDRVGE